MEHIGTVAVAHKKHVAHKRIESVAQPEVFLQGCAGKVSLYLALRIKLGLHAVTLAVDALQILAAHLVGASVEDTVEHPIGNEGLGEALLLEVEPVLHDFLTAHSPRRSKLARQSIYTVEGYLPNAEEA